MVAEVALSVVLIVVGGQLLGNFLRLVAIDPGFQADRVLASVVLPAPERYKDPERRALFYRRILDSVRALPGVQSAGTVDALPFSGENHGGFVSDSEGGAGQALTAEIDVAGGEYLQTMGVHLVEGRWFREEEMSPANDAAIVNTLVAGRLWPGASAVGQRICVYCTPENPRNWKRVIGVVSSASHAALGEAGEGQCLPGRGGDADIGVPGAENGAARGRNGEGRAARDRRDRSQPAGIPQRVDARPDRGLGGGPPFHHDAAGRSRAASRWRLRRPGFTA